MAEIVLGLGTSHSPMLSTPPDPWWPIHAERDKLRTETLDPQGTARTYDDLVALAKPDIDKELTPEVWQARWDAGQRAVAKVAEALAKAAPDIVVIIGNDQLELFHDDNMPAVLVYWGETILNTTSPYGPSVHESLRAADWGWFEVDHDREYPVASDLGLHIISYLMGHDFDVALSRQFRPGRGVGHAFGHVFRRVMDPDHVIPSVPIMLNTYYPPNQPTPKRCYELGRAVRRAIEAWDSTARVAVVGSGGLSHFIVDEEIDRRCIQAMQSKDIAQIASLPLERLNSGTSEVRSLIAVVGAVEHLDMELFDYIPCYRSRAMTGHAEAFMQWT